MTEEIRLGKYTLGEVLGRGGYGTIYRATDTSLHVERAIKILHPALNADPIFIERFRQEARTAANLEHPNIVPVYDLGQHEGAFYLVMRLMKGGSVKDLLARETRLPLERAVEILEQVASGLDFAYGLPERLIHRDIKPGNILLDLEGTAKISDFGFSKALEGASSVSISTTGGLIGTPPYMAPELWTGRKAGPETDIYALGCMFYEMLTGELLFSGNSPAEVMTQHVLQGPDFKERWSERVPEALRPVLEKALSTEMSARYPSALEFAAAARRALEPALEPEEAAAEPEPAAQETVVADAPQAPEPARVEADLAPEPEAEPPPPEPVEPVPEPEPAAEETVLAAPVQAPEPAEVEETPIPAAAEPKPVPSEDMTVSRERPPVPEAPARPAQQPPPPMVLQPPPRQAPEKRSWLNRRTAGIGAGLFIVLGVSGCVVLAVYLLGLFFPGAAEPAQVAEEPEPAQEQVQEPLPDSGKDTGGDQGQVVEMPVIDPLVLAAPSCDYGGIIQAVEAIDALTVRFSLCRPDPAFMAKLAFDAFGVYSSDWLTENAADQDALIHQPVGTGPFTVESWTSGDSIVLARFDRYWGTAPNYTTLVFRWTTEGAARLLELQSGTVNYITEVDQQDHDAVEEDAGLQLLPKPATNPNILYLGMANTFSPFDRLAFRQGIAMGLNRQRIVESYFPVGSEVADHFTPCSIDNGCVGDPWYTFDPETAFGLVAEALAEAGYEMPFQTTLYYRDVVRPYLPDPGAVAAELQDQLLDILAIDAKLVVMGSGEFIADSTAGNLEGFYLLGWSAEYPHVTNLLDFHFGSTNPQFGEPHPEIYEPLEKAFAIADPGEAEPLYIQANNAIRELVPMVPIAHAASANAALGSLRGAYAPQFGAPNFALMDPGDDTLEVMQRFEPAGLYCADETDPDAFAVCRQIVETLFTTDPETGAVVPLLATGCEVNADATEYLCTLRSGVFFHDGTLLDANDVVVSWTAGLDASSPLHTGNFGGFDYFAYLWNGLMNVP